MRFWEAQKSLDEGKKIRHKTWENGKWVSLHLDNYKPNEPTQNYFAIVGHFREGWELYEEPNKLISFAEVIKGLKEGKKFRRAIWSSEKFICMSYIYAHIWHHKGDAAAFSVQDFEAKDWIEVD
jgi:hypothetical protein